MKTDTLIDESVSQLAVSDNLSRASRSNEKRRPDRLRKLQGHKRPQNTALSLPKGFEYPAVNGQSVNVNITDSKGKKIRCLQSDTYDIYTGRRGAWQKIEIFKGVPLPAGMLISYKKADE